jgi:hypothetical protein
MILFSIGVVLSIIQPTAHSPVTPFPKALLGCKEKIRREKKVRENVRREKYERNRIDLWYCLV